MLLAKGEKMSSSKQASTRTLTSPFVAPFSDLNIFEKDQTEPFIRLCCFSGFSELDIHNILTAIFQGRYCTEPLTEKTSLQNLKDFFESSIFKTCNIPVFVEATATLYIYKHGIELLKSIDKLMFDFSTNYYSGKLPDLKNFCLKFERIFHVLNSHPYSYNMLRLIFQNNEIQSGSDIDTSKNNFSAPLTPEKELPIGYHVRKIEKGVVGQLSKIKEELDEAMDANEQENKIMELTELSDIYGALEARVQTLGFQMEDLKKMSDVTKRAFFSGRRK